MVKIRFIGERTDYADRNPMTAPLTDRERHVLEAVIETYVQTAEPAGSRTIAQRHQLGLSPATIRNTMSDLEAKGYLYHPHTSAGRIPTDLAYRVYVDFLMRPPLVAAAEAQHLRGELLGQRAAVETILARAAQVLGVLTNELGVAMTPTIDEAVLDRPGARRRAARDLHAGDIDLSLRPPDRRDRRHGADADGLRQDRRARQSHLTTRRGAARIA